MSIVANDASSEETVHPELVQSDAVLLILEAVHQEGKPTERMLLEGLACLGWKTGSQDDTQCRVLRSFATDAWRRRLHGSLAHLVQTRQIRRHREGYMLTDLGRAAIKNLPPSADGAEEEVDQIRYMADHVRNLLSLD